MRFISVILFFLFFSYCNSFDNMLFIKNILSNEKKEFYKYKAYYIIPPNICTGCNTHPLKTSFRILQEDYPVKVIFECFPENYKELKARLIEECVINKKNFVIDTLVQYNNFDSVTLVNTPSVIYIDAGMINKVEFLDSNNPQAVNNLISNYR